MSRLDDDAGPRGMPPRSVLYALPWDGAGTPYAQSLTSYIVQLADAHSVRPKAILARLFDYAIRLEKPSRETPPYVIQHEELPSLVSFGRTSRLIVAAADALTRQSVAGVGTFAHLEGIVARNRVGLAARHRQWCPACLLERQTGRKRAVAEPLVWTVACATACAVHATRLTTSCLTCGKPQPYLAQLPNNVSCWCCRNSLFAPAGRLPKADERGLWYARELGWLVEARTQLASAPAFSSFQKSVCRILRVTGLTYSALDRGLGFSGTLVRQWLTKESRPRLDFLLHFSFQLSLPLSTLLLSPGAITSFCSRDPVELRVRDAPNPPNAEQLRESFLKLLRSEGPTLNLGETAIVLKTTIDRLRYYCPDLCKEVRRIATSQAESRRSSLADLAPTLIEDVTRSIAKSGRYPSFTAVRRALPRPARIRLDAEPELQALRTRIAAASKIRRPAGARGGSLQLSLDAEW